MSPIAGNYPDVPGARLAYDRDGTQGYILTSGYASVASQLTAAQLQGLNKEIGGGATISSPGGNAYATGLVFPQPVDLVGAFYSGNGSDGPTTAQVSSDTTNLIDGTWTTYSLGPVTAMGTAYRTAIHTGVATGVKGLRWSLWQAASRFLHLYGSPSANSDRLRFWHPTLDQPLSQTPAWLDWGNRARATTATKQFRIKNLSTALTASAIVIGIEALTDATPTFVGQHTFSLDGVTFAGTVTLPSLAPGQVSQVVTVQQSLTSAAALSVWAQRIFANAGSWA